MVFPKKLPNMGNMQNTTTNLGNLYVHPNLLGFHPSNDTNNNFRVSSFPPSRKFVPTHSKAAANIDVYTFPGDFNHQVSRNFLFSARLRAKDACCHEEEPLQVFKKRLKSLFEVNLPNSGHNFMFGWRRNPRFEWK